MDFLDELINYYQDDKFNLEMVERLAMTSTFHREEVYKMMETMEPEDLYKLLRENQQIPGLHRQAGNVIEQFYASKYFNEKEYFYERNTTKRPD